MDAVIVAAIAFATAFVVWYKVKKFKEGIVKRRKEIEDGDNKIKWL